MWIKAGVDISRLNREIRRALQTVDSFVTELGFELHVSSTFECNHGAGSLHYSNDAFDFTRPELSRDDVDSLRAAVGASCDVVRKPDHVHIEYDPK